MKIVLVVAVLVGGGWLAGATYMRWSISQMFAEGQGRTICEAVLSESPR